MSVGTMTDFSPRELAGRYVAVWTEPDAELRRKAIQELWAEDGAHILQPPQEIRQAAAGLGFTSAVLETRGHDELQARVTRAYQDRALPAPLANEATATSAARGRSQVPTMTAPGPGTPTPT